MSVPPKKVTNSDTGTADVIGGDDWDALSDYFNNVDKTGPAKINTATQFRSTKLQMRNPADTFAYSVTTSAIAANRTITEPLLIANDTRVYEAHIQSLTNKTLDSTNTISSATSLPTVTVAKGGTGQTTATLGFDALSPMTTAGDIITGGASGTRTRLQMGAANLPLKVNSGATALEYGALAVAGGGTGATTLTGVMKGNGTSAVTAAAQLAVADGGTGAATLTGVVKGNGTSAFTTLTGTFFGVWSGCFNGTSNTVRYHAINGGANAGLTEADFALAFTYAVTLKRIRYIVSGNTKDQNTVVSFRDDGADVDAFTITSSSNTDHDSGVISTAVGAGSLICFKTDASASTTGTILVNYFVEWEGALT